MDISKYLEFDAKDRALREKNLATILAYLGCRGDERLERWKYFTPDGQGGYTGPGKYDNYDFTEDGVPGHEGLKGSDAWNCRFFPDFEFTDLKVMQTQDPNYYVDAFAMEDGLIRRCTEYNNPEHLLADHSAGLLR